MVKDKTSKTTIAGLADMVAKGFDSMGQKFDSIDQKIGSMDQKIGSMDQKMNSMDQRIGHIEQTMATKSDIKEVNDRITRLDFRVEEIHDILTTEQDEIIDLQKRVGIIEHTSKSSKH